MIIKKFNVPHEDLLHIPLILHRYFKISRHSQRTHCLDVHEIRKVNIFYNTRTRIGL